MQQRHLILLLFLMGFSPSPPLPMTLAARRNGTGRGNKLKRSTTTTTTSNPYSSVNGMAPHHPYAPTISTSVVTLDKNRLPTGGPSSKSTGHHHHPHTVFSGGGSSGSSSSGTSDWNTFWTSTTSNPLSTSFEGSTIVGGGGGAISNSTSLEEWPVPIWKKSSYSPYQIIILTIISVILMLITVLGNILVLVSFKIDKQLQTISNYFLLSLALADFMIGLVSMPLCSVYLILGFWPFGPTICDAWLALDYWASNASVLNLLIISFDRYFSVTRPLTYRARRTTRRAAVMITAAWGISALLWPPWIYAWPAIEGSRTVPPQECYIQFIQTNYYITFGTAIAAFYVPVSIMLFLYWQIWRETEKRREDFTKLQADKKDSSRRSNSSDEAAMDVEEWTRMRSESCICTDHSDQVSTCPAHSRRRSQRLPRICYRRWDCFQRLCWTFVRFCRVDRDQDDVDEGEEDHVSPGCGTPASIETPLQSSVSRCTSLNVIRDPLAQTPTRKTIDSTITTTSTQNPPVPPSSAATSPPPPPSPLSPNGPNGKLSAGPDSVYTILIRIPGDTEANKNASIRMIQDPGPLPPPTIKAKLASTNPDHPNFRSTSPPTTGGGGGGGGPLGPTNSGTSTTGSATGYGMGRRISSAVSNTLTSSKLMSKSLMSGKGSTTTLAGTLVNSGSGGGAAASGAPNTLQQKRKKKKNQEKKQEKKAAKTLSAILLAFIVTWTPYNILVLLRTVLATKETDVDDPIPQPLWDMAYYLCYINSTINPVCYALCNASFRRTYVRILTCKWDNSRRQAVNRGYYN